MKIVRLEGNDIRGRRDLHAALKTQLDFPDYYGHNLDALWDCLNGWIALPLTLEWHDLEQCRTTLGEHCEKAVQVLREADESIDGFTFREM